MPCRVRGNTFSEVYKPPACVHAQQRAAAGASVSQPICHLHVGNESGENMGTKNLLGRANTSISASSAEVRKVSVLTFHRLHYYLASDSVSSSLSARGVYRGFQQHYLYTYCTTNSRSITSFNHPKVNSSYHSANLALSTIVQRPPKQQDKRKHPWGIASKPSTSAHTTALEHHRLSLPSSPPTFPIMLSTLPPNVGLLSTSFSRAYLLLYSLSVSGSSSP